MYRLALACAALLASVACGHDPTPIEPRTSGTTRPADAHPSPTPTPPEMPQTAHRNDFKGRAAFAGYWIHVLNYSVATGQTSMLSSISGQGCTGCQNYLRQIRRDVASENESIGFNWKPIAAQPGSNNDVTVQVDASKYRRIDDAGNTVVVPKSEYEVGFELERKADGWRVREMFLPE